MHNRGRGAQGVKGKALSSLFHSLVVCGAGLTLVSCGGRSESGQQESEPAQGGSSNQGGSGPVATGLVSNGGGLMLTPSGGTNTAGSSSLGGTATTMPGPLLPGAEGQWVCDSELTGCATSSFEGMQTYGFRIGSACAADPTRPKSSEDCTGQAKLSCAIGFFDDQAVLFNCECKTPALSDGCPCPEAGGGCYGARGPDYCDELQAYCGCAMTCIAK